MAKERLIKLPQTKGEFKISGIVTGTEKGDKFFKSKKTKKGLDMNMLSFGIETDKNSTVYTSLNGTVRDDVYFYKRPDKNKGEKKGTTKKVPWVERYRFNEEGFKLIGMNIGVSKKLSEKGEEVNDNKMLTEYDACKHIADNLADGQSVFTRGNIEFSSYKNDKGDIKRNTKFVPSQVSLCKDIDFEKEDFKPNNQFKQVIIFESIEMDTSDKNDPKARVTAKLVTYNTIETAEFIIRNKSLYNTFKKNLKPYSSIKVWGEIQNHVETEEVTENDVWGEENNFDKINKPTIRELVITGADPNTIDVDTYSEEALDEAVRSLKEFGEETSKKNDNDEWGSVNDTDTNDEDDEW
ncbi:UNVERIFIED_ORG: hypothetical protein B2H93_04440 [Clostridium botulinum]